MLESRLHAWQLVVDGEPFHTATSTLLPVRTRSGEAAMLKHAKAPEERAGLPLLAWWGGDGAVRVLAYEGDVVLMERVTGDRDLLQWATQDAVADLEASGVLCEVLLRLHAPRATRPPALAPLAAWFDALEREAARRGGLFSHCAQLARALLASTPPGDLVPLHGDCHHRNVLDGGARGWLAIDPKDRFGDRGFDHALILCNPDLKHAADPARFAAHLARVAAGASLSPARLAQWTAARSALSAVWFLEDGDAASADHDLAIARTALAWLADAG